MTLSEVSGDEVSEGREGFKERSVMRGKRYGTKTIVGSSHQQRLDYKAIAGLERAGWCH